jgi:hypothetical protein
MGVILSDLDSATSRESCNFSQLESFLARQSGLIAKAIDAHEYADALLFTSTALNRLFSEVGPMVPAWEAPQWAMREITNLNSLQKTLRLLATPFQTHVRDNHIG